VPKIKTRARALDMLGRQQINGIPTALSELFKNSHDAYADNVEVDFIRKKNLLILRDDGLGMSKDEFEARWLTIGTDSKLDDEDSIEQPAIKNIAKKRPVMGEKGIGRLAIAAVGPQVLVITRSNRDGILGNLVAAFINWTLFSFPALDLEDIEIPMLEIEGGNNLTKAQVESLLKEAKANVRSLGNKISRQKIDSVCTQIKQFDFDPEFWASKLNQLDGELNLKRDHLRLDDKGFGTHFIISPVDEILEDEIQGADTRKRTDQASRLEKALLGFTNTMYEGSTAPIIARFRDHTMEGECIDRISEAKFFDPQDFKNADHHFEGHFNEFGQFSGAVTVYGHKHDVVVSWPDGVNKEILCGPFDIKLAYIQGAQRDTKAPPDIWKSLTAKTDRIGGLYLYRDNIRLLPYGDSDYDFLRIEQRRSKSAKESYFSYRRMFGAIELTRSQNSALEEKAGREGFRENKAYKQFKAILEHFFVQIAADYFRDSGILSDIFIETRKRRQDEYKLLQKRSQLKSTKKRKLREQLQLFFSRLDDDFWKIETQRLSSAIDELFKNSGSQKNSIDDFVFEVESYLSQQVKSIEALLEIKKGNGIGYGKELEEWWDRYQLEKAKITESIVDVKNNTGQRLLDFEDKYGNRTGLRRRFNDSILVLQEFHNQQLNDAYKKTNSTVELLQQEVKVQLKEGRKAAKANIETVKSQFLSTDFSNKTSKELFEVKKSLESKIEQTSLAVLKSVETLTEQLLTAKEGSDENAIASNKLTAILESEYENLKEQQEQNMEMVQLGMALGVINHEFNSNILSIRRGLNDMKPYTQKSGQFKTLYEKVRTGFDHLDGYLSTFTPLTRRLSRKRMDIQGVAVYEFILNVFDERLKKEDIQVVCTSAFKEQHIFSFTSTIFPAFVNIVDNSIHWLSRSSGEKIITLGATKTGFSIKDSGPGIPTIDHENVFEFGFSRRVGGQGMGLYVTQETLKKDGVEITLKPYQPDSGAVFNIEPQIITDELD
jgi:signal transduction histidine kinase